MDQPWSRYYSCKCISSRLICRENFGQSGISLSLVRPRFWQDIRKSPYIHGRHHFICCQHPRQYKFEFHMPGMIANHCKNLGHVWKIKTLPIFTIKFVCDHARSLDVCNFQFPLVDIIWDGHGTVKSQIVWDFPDIWKIAFIWLLYCLIHVKVWSSPSQSIIIFYGIFTYPNYQNNFIKMETPFKVQNLPAINNCPISRVTMNAVLQLRVIFNPFKKQQMMSFSFEQSQL